MLPFKEKKIEDYFIREFSFHTNSNEFVWHRDREDRIISAINENDWKFQFDNQLPIDINEKEIFIPKNTFHRIIKGSGNLKIKLKKL